MLGTKTSSFGLIPIDWRATCKAAVPELKHTTSLLKKDFRSFSNFLTSGPMPRNSFSKIFVTKLISSFDIQDLESFIIFFWNYFFSFD